MIQRGSGKTMVHEKDNCQLPQIVTVFIRPPVVNKYCTYFLKNFTSSYPYNLMTVHSENTNCCVLIIKSKASPDFIETA